MPPRRPYGRQRSLPLKREKIEKKPARSARSSIAQSDYSFEQWDLEDIEELEEPPRKRLRVSSPKQLPKTVRVSSRVSPVASQTRATQTRPTFVHVKQEINITRLVEGAGGTAGAGGGSSVAGRSDNHKSTKRSTSSSAAVQATQPQQQQPPLMTQQLPMTQFPMTQLAMPMTQISETQLNIDPGSLSAPARSFVVKVKQQNALLRKRLRQQLLQEEREKVLRRQMQQQQKRAHERYVKVKKQNRQLRQHTDKMQKALQEAKAKETEQQKSEHEALCRLHVAARVASALMMPRATDSMEPVSALCTAIHNALQSRRADQDACGCLPVATLQSAARRLRAATSALSTLQHSGVCETVSTMPVPGLSALVSLLDALMTLMDSRNEAVLQSTLAVLSAAIAASGGVVRDLLLLQPNTHPSDAQRLRSLSVEEMPPDSTVVRLPDNQALLWPDDFAVAGDITVPNITDRSSDSCNVATTEDTVHPKTQKVELRLHDPERGQVLLQLGTCATLGPRIFLDQEALQHLSAAGSESVDETRDDQSDREKVLQEWHRSARVRRRSLLYLVLQLLRRVLQPLPYSLAGQSLARADWPRRGRWLQRSARPLLDPSEEDIERRKRVASIVRELPPDDEDLLLPDESEWPGDTDIRIHVSPLAVAPGSVDVLWQCIQHTSRERLLCYRALFDTVVWAPFVSTPMLKRGQMPLETLTCAMRVVTRLCAVSRDFCRRLASRDRVCDFLLCLAADANAAWFGDERRASERQWLRFQCAVLEFQVAVQLAHREALLPLLLPSQVPLATQHARFSRFVDALASTADAVRRDEEADSEDEHTRLRQSAFALALQSLFLTTQYAGGRQDSDEVYEQIHSLAQAAAVRVVTLLSQAQVSARRSALLLSAATAVQHFFFADFQEFNMEGEDDGFMCIANGSGSDGQEETAPDVPVPPRASDFDFDDGDDLEVVLLETSRSCQQSSLSMPQAASASDSGPVKQEPAITLD